MHQKAISEGTRMTLATRQFPPAKPDLPRPAGMTIVDLSHAFGETRR